MAVTPFLDKPDDTGEACLNVDQPALRFLLFLKGSPLVSVEHRIRYDSGPARTPIHGSMSHLSPGVQRVILGGHTPFLHVSEFFGYLDMAF